MMNALRRKARKEERERERRRISRQAKRSTETNEKIIPEKDRSNSLVPPVAL